MPGLYMLTQRTVDAQEDLATLKKNMPLVQTDLAQQRVDAR